MFVQRGNNFRKIAIFRTIAIWKDDDLQENAGRKKTYLRL